MRNLGVELLAPAGCFKTALAAFEAGADAVYCGLGDFSARAFAENFSEAELARLCAYAHGSGRKVYVTFNTLVDEADIGSAVRALSALAAIGPDALIVQDLGVADICRRSFPGLELHASTQLVAHNLEGVLALKELGFRRVVLARELSLEEVASIARRAGVFAVSEADGRSELELECFVHGALCYSLSGLCLFGAMEKGRSGNRGTCPYCCRQAYDTGRDGRRLCFSMKDLRLGEEARRLADCGVASLKIEGRMKSELYVASVTRYYRQILGGGAAHGGRTVTTGDLETVFSRRTTRLYLGTPAGRGAADSPIDPESLGHLGAEIGAVKRIARDRDGRRWLRFHTARALERHDGLQFGVWVDGRPLGMGVADMRTAISRRNVFEVAAGSDVEVLLPDDPQAAAEGRDLARLLTPGVKVYCSMSNAVKRLFPAPAYRPSDYSGPVEIKAAVTLAPGCASVRAEGAEFGSVSCSLAVELGPAQHPERTFAAVEKAFSKFGGTDYRVGRLELDDPDRLFAPMSALNDLRRDLVAKLDEARARERSKRLDAALEAAGEPVDLPGGGSALRTVKLRLGSRVPAGDWSEIVALVGAETTPEAVAAGGVAPERLRLALPVYNGELGFNRLRQAVKRLMRAGHAKWEASDLATLRLLTALGATDVTADWSLYAFNLSALRLLARLGVKRFVASPENGRENLQFLAESGCPVEFLVQQSTPLFVSLTEPAGRPEELAVFSCGGLWVTTRRVPRTFEPPSGVSTRVDLSWDPEVVAP